MMHALSLALAIAPTIAIAPMYVLGPGTTPDQVRICAARPAAAPATQLVLRGHSDVEQIAEVVCGEHLLRPASSGCWRVPAGCGPVCWTVFLQHEGTLASQGASFRRGSFALLSEVSALPHLEDQGEPGWLTFRAELDLPGPSVPPVDTAGRIALSGDCDAPVVVLLGASPVRHIEARGVRLSYFIDDRSHAAQLPDMDRHLAAAAWLRDCFAPDQDFALNMAWVGVPATELTLAGMAGRDVLVSNYPLNGAMPGGDTALLYVALHEAVHQVAPHPITWISESLASYYGLRALQLTSPIDPAPRRLADRFRADAAAYPQGLLAVQRAVERGDRSAYGAFYTKGWAFWEQADKVLQAERGVHLEQVLPRLLHEVELNHNGVSAIEGALALSADSWSRLRQTFLDDPLNGGGQEG